MPINVELVKLARQVLEHRKVAFQPPGGGAPPGMDPMAMGGMPPGMPMDPAMMGGMPPGAPPMDPAMMGGMPPMDPMAAMGGAPVPGGGGLTADTLRQIIQEEMAKAPVNGAAAGKPGKPDLLAMSMDIFQMKKMLFDVINAMGLPVSRDILDGPNRDPTTGAPAAGPTPPSPSAPPAEAPPASAIKPIEPMKGAFPSAPAEGGAGEKSGAMGSVYVTSAAASGKIQNKAAALAACLRKPSR